MSGMSDDLFLGTAVTGITGNGPSPMSYGVGPMGRQYNFDILPAALAANNLATTQMPAGAGSLTLTAGAGVTLTTNALGNTIYSLDVARNVRVSSDADDTSVTFTVTGFDFYGQKMSEVITGPNNATASGNKAFKSILSVAISAAATGNITVGTGDKFGLPFAITNIVYVSSAKWASALAADAGTFVAADATTATTTTGDVRGTYTPSSASNGSRRLCMVLSLTAIACGPNATRAGALGVDQNLAGQ